jgi:hypothetical protein
MTFAFVPSIKNSSRDEREAGVCAKMPLGKPCESGGIGRRTGFRFQRRKAWGFESLLSHQHCGLTRCGFTVAHGISGAVRVAFSQYVSVSASMPIKPHVKPRSRIIVKKPSRLKEFKD